MSLGTAEQVAKNGFAIISDIIDADRIAALVAVTANAELSRSTRGDQVYGARNILAVAEIAALSRDPEIVSLVESLIGRDGVAVRGIFFDKTPGANWPVAWHQDLSLAVSERKEIAGWGNWSVKAGVQHVQPPAEILEKMITLRIQLDESDADNGPLRVLPGSHQDGRITANKIASYRDQITEHFCTAPSGSAIAMKPLILHASSSAKSPRHRRVVHIEYAPRDLLPSELNWAFSI